MDTRVQANVMEPKNRSNRVHAQVGAETQPRMERMCAVVAFSRLYPNPQ